MRMRGRATRTRTRARARPPVCARVARLHLLVREFFGLVDLSRLQPVVFGAMIVGEMLGMALPGVLYDAFGTYCASLLVSFASTLVTVACFALMHCEHPLGAPPILARMPSTPTPELM